METKQEEEVRFDETQTEGQTLGGYNTKPAEPIEVDDEFGNGKPSEAEGDEAKEPSEPPVPEPPKEPKPEPVEPPKPPAASSNSGSGKKKDDTKKKSDAKKKETKATPAPSGGAPVRTYIVFEEFELEGAKKSDPTTKGYQEVHRVDARNAENAIRKAYKEIAANQEEAKAVLVVVPESMWRPTPVHLRPRTTVSVSIG